MSHSDDPRTKYHSERRRLQEAVEAGEIDTVTATKVGEVVDALDAENHAYVYSNGSGTKTLATKSLENYTLRLRMAAQEIGDPLLELDNDAINRFISDLSDGSATIAPDGGYSKGTIGQYQSALKVFYRYFDGHDVDPEAIPVAAPEKTSIDERDMFTREEIEAMRKAIDTPRERAIFELLAYSGQRIRVIQTLRIKDVDVQEGVFWINEDADGRKGAQGKRPLLGAREYIYQWLEYHPRSDDPEAALFTALPSNGGSGKVGEPLTQDTIRYHLNKFADRAGVNKKVHPHIFRHYFTTIAKRDYGMDDSMIKKLRGDAPGSNVMETTYRHLSDDDAIQHAEEKMGYRDTEPDTPLSPSVCPTCHTELEPGAKACPRCGALFSPDARAVKDQLEEEIGEEKERSESLDTYKLLDKLEHLAETNPDLLEKLDAL